MSDLNEFNWWEVRTLWFFLGLLIISFFLNLGIYPLFLEEPRRAIIALEMMLQDNMWVPTQTGDLYFRKPPMFNWMIILSYKIFGINEFAVRFVSVLSHLILGLLSYRFAQTKFPSHYAVIIAFGYLLSVDILLYFSTLGEIDLFYALITTASIFAIVHYGDKGKNWQLFLVLYLLSAFGFLTKGLSTIPFTGISLLVYFIINRKFKRIFSIEHVVGIFLFVIVVGLYFLKYKEYHSLDGWWETLFSESADKAIGGDVSEYLTHIITFPLDTFKNLLPLSLFGFFFFKKRVLIVLMENRLLVILLSLILANFMVYWLSSEGKSRYIYPIFPLACMFFVGLYYKIQSERSEVILKRIVFGVLTLGLIAFSLIPFAEPLQLVEGRVFISVIALLLTVILIYALLKKKVRAMIALLALLCIAKFIFSIIVPQTRQKTTGAAEHKQIGIEIAELTKGNELHRLGDVRMSLTMVFYVEKERQDVLDQELKFDSGFYFCYEEDLPSSDFYIAKEFAYHERPIYLIFYNQE